METPVTTTDIARKLGVSQSTVSLALRDSPRIGAATRTLIRQTAREMGYRPNSFARALSVIRQAKRPVFQRGVLALLAPPIPLKSTALEGLLHHTRHHAGKLGYDLDLIQFHLPGMTSRRLTQILKARGVTGLLVLPDFVSMRVLRRLQLDWSFFPAVTLGNALLWPPLHRVGDNHFGNAKRMVRELASLGYRRIGLCVHPPLATIHADGGWEGGYSVGMQRLGGALAPFYHDNLQGSLAEILAWAGRERLDAIMVDSLAMALYLSENQWPKVPESLGIASFMGTPLNHISGINPEYQGVWAMAVDFLVHLIHTNQRGIPQFPQRILLEGSWHAGETVRRVTGSVYPESGF